MKSKNYRTQWCHLDAYRERADIHEYYTLCWKNISVWSRCKMSRGVFRKAWYKDIRLLSNIDGFVQSGSLVAIMGPSGCGKTTLLTTISHRSRGKIRGSVFVNGEKISAREMLAISGFVPQTDLNVDSLTVYEHMYFMAVLKMSKKTSEVERLSKISSLLNEFGLEKHTWTYLRNLSGGERKRLSIAVQLLTDPYMLFCDEPTTGLDSWNAANVVGILRKFSSQGKIVICSIHQPASGVFELFDDVLLLATGGRMAFFGPVTEAAEYFERFQLKCPVSYNIAEFLIKAVSTRYLSDNGRVEVICRAFATSNRASVIKEKVRFHCLSQDSFFVVDSFPSCGNKKFSDVPEKLRNINYSEINRVGFFVQLYYLIWRSAKNLRVSYPGHVVNFLSLMMIILLISSIFAKVYHTEEHRRQNIWGFLKIVVNQVVYFFTKFVLSTFLEERPLLLRERASRLYSIEAYYMSKIVCKVIHSMVLTLVFVTVLKCISDVFDPVGYAELVFVFGVIVVSSVASGYLLSAIFDDVSLLILTSVVLLNVSCFVSGFYSNLRSYPILARWMKYLSLQYYSIQAVAVLEWSSVDLDEMRRYNISFDDPDAFRNLKLVAEYGFYVVDYRYNLCVLASFALFFYFIAYVVVTKRSKNQAVY